MIIILYHWAWVVLLCDKRKLEQWSPPKSPWLWLLLAMSNIDTKFPYLLDLAIKFINLAFKWQLPPEYQGKAEIS